MSGCVTLLMSVALMLMWREGRRGEEKADAGMLQGDGFIRRLVDQ